MAKPFIQEFAKIIAEMHDASYQGDLADDAAFRTYLHANHYEHIRKLPDGTWIGIVSMIYFVSLCVDLGRGGYEKRYDYDDVPLAISEAHRITSGDEVPAGWISKLPK